ncbi:sensor histidine kinase, partial [Amycolatopsis sp. NPDC000746]
TEELTHCSVSGVLRCGLPINTGGGGADQHAGGAMTGVADRSAVVGGTVALSSPPGGPTVVRVRIPSEPLS